MRSSAARSLPLDDSRPIWQLLLVFLIPLMLSNVLQAVGATANAIYLGRLVGVSALAAVSSIFPIVFFLISFLIGLGSGSTILIGQAFGAREHAKIKQVAGTTLALTILLGIVVGTLGGVFTIPLLHAIGTPLDVIGQAESYSRITFFCLPVFFVYLVYTTFLRGVGDSKTPFFALIGSTALTMLFTPALILGWFGLPKMGVDGAAAGNVAGNVCGLAGLLVYLARVKNPLALDREILANMKLRWHLVWQIVRIGVPVGVNLVMVSLSEIAVVVFVNRFGSTATAAYGAVNQVVSYVQFPAISIGIASSIFGAQAIGAKRFDRLTKIVRSGVTLNYLIEGALIGLCYAFSWAIIGLFITDPATIAVAHRLLMITLWSYAIFGNARVLSGIMLSSGTVLWPTLLSIFSIWGVEVPVAYILMQRWGLDGVWYGYPSAFIAGLIFQSCYYFFVWKRQAHKRLI
jgi:putative MATE family efflux protein